MVNVVVDDVTAVEARLIAHDTGWHRELEETAWGTVGTVLDPDGNFVQVIHVDQQRETRT